MIMKRTTRRFAWLIRLLPVDVREAHGNEMSQVLASADADRPRGFIPAVSFWLGVAWDVFTVAVRQHAAMFGQDVRYALRSLRRSPLFAASALSTIALAIGAALAVFSVVNAVLIRPLPFENPSTLALVWAMNAEGGRSWLAAPEIDDLDNRATSLDGVAGLTDLRLALTGNGTPEELDVVAASASLFELLGTRPHRGRLLERSDDRDTSARVVVLGHALWTRRFGASPDVMGKTITLDGRAYTIVGVLPRAFGLIPPSSVFPHDADAWVALQPHLISRARDVRYLHAIARVNGDVSFDAAGEEIAAIGQLLSREFADASRSRSWTFALVPMKEDVVREVRPALLALLATVVMVLLIASVNVATLLLTRAQSRRREMAVRTALGASRGRLTRQLLTEGLVLATLGGLAGSAIALAAPAISRVPVIGILPRFADVAFDWRVGVCAVGLIGVTALIFALAPTMELSESAVDRRTGTLRSAAGLRRTLRAGRWLAAGEVALASAVLVVALLFAKNLASLLGEEPGFTTTNVFTARVSLPPKYQTAEAISRFFDEVHHRLRTVGGVQAVGAVTQLPLSGAALGSSFTADVPANAASRIDVDLRGATPGYFETLRVPILRGRGFSDADTRTSPPVAIVDQIAARQLWPGQDPVGQRIRWIRQPDVSIEVIGVAGSVKHRGVQQPGSATVYRPHTQYARSTMYLVARTDARDTLTERAVAATVSSVDPDQPLADAIMLDQLQTRSFAHPGFGAGLGTALALLAVALAAVGVYGVHASAVVQRRREMGVRLAVGGTPGRIERLVLADGLKVVLLGLAAGAPGAFVAARAMSAFLPAAAAFDLSALAASCVVMLLVALLACWIPARRVSRVDPAIVLKAEP